MSKRRLTARSLARSIGPIGCSLNRQVGQLGTWEEGRMRYLRAEATRAVHAAILMPYQLDLSVGRSDGRTMLTHSVPAASLLDPQGKKEGRKQRKIKEERASERGISSSSRPS